MNRPRRNHGVEDTAYIDAKTAARTKTKNRIILVVLLVSLVVLLISMGYNFSRTVKNARNDMIELSKSSSALNAESIEMFFTRHEDVLLATTETIEHSLKSGFSDIESIRELLRDMSDAYNTDIYKRYADKDFTGIYVSHNGTLIHAYKTDDDLPAGYDPTKRQWYSEGMAGKGKIVFGNPYNDAYDPNIVVMTATKLLNDGETVIGMDIPLDDMQYAGGKMDVSVTVNGNRQSYGYGFVMTGDGVVMAHRDETQQGLSYGDPESPMNGVFTEIKACVSGGNDYIETKVDGVKYGIFPHKLDNGWYVVTMTDLEDIRSSISDYSRIILTTAVIAIVLGSLYCLFILRAYLKSKMLTDTLIGALDLATIDTLTALGNRTAFDIRTRELQDNMNTGMDTSFVLVMTDLNDLKYINDHFGHSNGDLYINNCCKLLMNTYPGEIYRIGGDEFALFLTGDSFEQRDKIITSLKQSVLDANLALVPTVDRPSMAIGLATHNAGDDDDMDSLLREADAEMYANKVTIKRSRLDNSESGYSTDLKLKLLDKQTLASETNTALEEEQFEIWFQPQVNHENNGSLIGAEALVRWNHPTRGMISPTEFIPLFEYNGFIYDLDKYVWKHACASIRKWLDEGMAPMPISVNVSRLDLIEPDFIDTVTSIVDEYNIPHDLLHLEVTESAFADDTGVAVRIVKELIALGFIIAIDDFGSGYSSLSLLRWLPAHIIKLDMRFFSDGEEQARNECIIESIIRMGKMLGMAVLAEGVEHIEQADLLRALGCAYIQGYIYSPPLPPEKYIEYTNTAVNEAFSHDDFKSKSQYDSTTEQSHKLFHDIISGTNDVIIVADSKTRQLLYANRAAEQHFGKRFDPLHSTTCMEYCNKGSLCENCPAAAMKPGERREFVTSENGTHIKSLYVQIDWNGHDAFAFYQTDITAEMRETELTKALMNSLGVGIVIFHGASPNEIVPVFCNDEFKNLSGLKNDEFKNIIKKENLYGVHPDDIDELRAVFAEAYSAKHQIHHKFRVIKGSGKYEWVSMLAKISFLDNGEFDVNVMFSDAEEEVQKLSIDKERYKNYIEETKQSASDYLAVMHLNLSRDTVYYVSRSINARCPDNLDCGIDHFIADLSRNLPNDEISAEFARKFSLATLRENFERGIFADMLEIPVRLLNERIIWCYQDVKISMNPTTGDLEAIMMLTEADNDIRLDSHYRWLINTDYEFIGEINVKTGFLTVISEPNTRGIPYSDTHHSAVPYMTRMASRMKTLVDETAYDECIKALSYDTVIENLKTEKIYTCIFAANSELLGHDGAFQWRFGYVDDTKTDIIFYRKELDLCTNLE